LKARSASRPRSTGSTASERAAARRHERRLICERAATGRAKNFFYVILAIACLLSIRLTYLQVVRGPALAEKAREQHDDTVEIFGRRGTIYDRDGNVLSRSSPSESVYVDPHIVKNKTLEAQALAPLVRMNATDLEAMFGDDSRFRWVKRKISPAVVKRIEAMDLPGVYTVAEDTGLRNDPAGRLASHILGFVNIDEKGLDGLEYKYDALLRGTSGKKTIEVGDGSGPIPFGRTSINEPAKPGRSLMLTIDSDLEFATQHALAEGVAKYHARSGSAVVMDPWTGEVLALANVPDFDPNTFWRSSGEGLRDRTVTDAYEPGSTFKLFTVAAALENGVGAEQRYPSHDALSIGGAVIHNAEDGMMAGEHGSESIEDIIAYSHNVGAAEIGLGVGKTAMYRMIRKFGFGDYTNIELPGENPGIVTAPADWSGSSLATISFGHGISITPIALARGYAAIANGGILMRPRVVSALLAPDGTPIYRYGPEVERRVVSEKTAATLRRYLRAVVTRGTGNPTAKVPGFTTAGKTGTAQVVENGVYASGQYNASFAGYIPADHPRFVIVVKVERPRGSIYGGQVAAPIFTKIAHEAMIHVGVVPHIEPTAIPHSP
jgi:cell division protein FtsI (penicillin-binding protein 3)